MRFLNTLIGSMLAATSLLWLQGCMGSGELSPEEYNQWVSDLENPLRKERTVGDFTFDLQFLPLGFRAVQSLGSGLSEAGYRNYVEEHAGMQQYLLKVRTPEGQQLEKYLASNSQEIQSVAYYLSFGMQQDIYFEYGGERKPCSLYHFERTYGIGPDARFIVGFEVEHDQPGTVVVDSRVLKTGPVKISFEAAEVPELAF